MLQFTIRVFLVVVVNDIAAACCAACCAREKILRACTLLRRQRFRGKRDLKQFGEVCYLVTACPWSVLSTQSQYVVCVCNDTVGFHTNIPHSQRRLLPPRCHHRRTARRTVLSGAFHNNKTNKLCLTTTEESRSKPITFLDLSSFLPYPIVADKCMTSEGKVTISYFNDNTRTTIQYEA